MEIPAEATEAFCTFCDQAVEGEEGTSFSTEEIMDVLTDAGQDPDDWDFSDATYSIYDLFSSLEGFIVEEVGRGEFSVARL